MLGPQLHPRVNPTADPRLVVSNTIIQYSAVELEQAIVRELDENPALEMVERVTCQFCSRPLYGGFCPSCTRIEYEHQAGNPSSEAPSQETENEFDPLSTVAAPLTLAESLFMQLRLVLNEQEQAIALHILGSLDEHGYLSTSPAELARMLQTDTGYVQHVLEELQDLDPPGIGARTAEECLLLQVRRLERDGVAVPPAVRLIIQDHLEALGHQRFEQIRRVLTISREEVEEAFLFIRANLHPYPAHHYYAWDNPSPPTSPRVVPSVLIQRSATAASGYEVEVVESQRFLLRVNPLYSQLHQQSHPDISPEEREHVAAFLERARIFIGALQRRHQMLEKVATYLVNVQSAFLDHGPAYLRPLTQTKAARELGVHPSTISRSVSGKFAQLPSRSLLPLYHFFATEARVRELIRLIILQETDPLSDERIAEILRVHHGITLSRQMVANHREALGLPSARQRTILRRNKQGRS
ncbi:MAG TPA: hypothetical protein VKV19_03300 [Ktedonobacteraceae bacterium]|nr:hypothetical protein [Ktedonobacteraceae bacterium]